MAILPRAFAARDFPGRSSLAPGVQQLVALSPASHKPDVGLQHPLHPRSTGKATIPNMHDAPPPPPYCSIKHLLQFGTLSTGTLAACGPPVHRRERGSTRSLKYQQAKPMQTRDTDRASTRRIEEAWADTFEPAGLAGTHGAQVVILEGLW